MISWNSWLTEKKMPMRAKNTSVRASDDTPKAGLRKRRTSSIGSGDLSCQAMKRPMARRPAPRKARVSPESQPWAGASMRP